MARIVQAAMGKGQWSSYALSLRNFATYRLAQEFHSTARKTGSPVVRAYLLGHALELYLKSYLLKSGLTASALKKRNLGHNLDNLLLEAKAKGIEGLLRISPQLSEDIAKLNALYPETLRYFSLLSLLAQPQLPSLVRLFRFAVSLNKTLGAHVAIKT
ncbi:MAG: hypothetical protein Q7R68_06630 [Nitrospirales bacterium]|nr:hypothetical protein [Nitrospirales bacterium]